MPTVTVTETVNAPKETVFALLSDMSAFPRFMKSVDSVTIEESGPGYTISRWKAHIQGGSFEWRERDQFDPEAGEIRYEQLSGDLKVFRGFWRIAERDGTCEVTLQTEFEFGVPMLAALLNPVGKWAIRENSRAMLHAIAGRAGTDGVPTA